MISIHVGKHYFGEVEEVAAQLTTRLRHRKCLTREDVKGIFKKYFPSLLDESPLPDFLEMQPGELFGLYRKASEIDANGFLPYNDGGGYVDLVAIRGKVTEREVRCSVFKNCQDDEDGGDTPSDIEEREYHFGRRWSSFIV